MKRPCRKSECLSIIPLFRVDPTPSPLVSLDAHLSRIVCSIISQIWKGFSNPTILQTSKTLFNVVLEQSALRKPAST